MLLSTLLEELDYEHSPHYRSRVSEFEPETAHLFRAAHDAGVSGIYVFQASPATTQKVIVDRPAIYIAQARDLKHAQDIHRSLWNLFYAPYLIVLLPQQARIYTGFKYSEEDPNKGLLDEFPLTDLRLLLAEFSSEAIDTGRIWQKGKYKKQLDEQERVDKRLLMNLRQLGKQLKNRGLDSSVAHALIGKYVYIRYLWDRGILTEAWLQEQHLEKASIFSRTATAVGLSRLIAALEERFNGKIFPIDFTQAKAPTDLHVQLTASVFLGDETVREEKNEVIRQLHLDFQAYNFAYIPIEILSEVYEQFIEDARKKGAIYTPEILADYLLSEVSSVKPLTEETKILDPACGSGVFLVLAYRRLIEAELAKSGGSKLSDKKLKALLSNIYGVERELDACYIAEFSLILTLLNYVDPHELQKIAFHFPTLHNTTIFHSDFFDIEGTHYKAQFWQQGLTFDIIIGNPPWIELKDKDGEELAWQWMEDTSNKAERPVSRKRVAEAFSWLVTDLLRFDGIVGFILPATSLFNVLGHTYRKRFFTHHCILRITNFANLRWILFPKNEFPAFTMVYRPWKNREKEKPPIIHYSPLSIDQVTGTRESPWTITIKEQEIQTIDPGDAETGETLVWKLALWGTFQDKRAIETIETLFPSTLEDFCKKRNWPPPSEGVQLRNKQESTEDLQDRDDLKGKTEFQREMMSNTLFRFSVPSYILAPIPEEMCAIRKRGGKQGFSLMQAPHIVISPSWGSFVTFSELDFLIPPRVIGIAGPQEDADTLRALSLYLKSSLVSYYLFFHVPEWGVFKNASYITLGGLKQVLVPDLHAEQVKELASLHQRLVVDEKQYISAAIANARNLQPDLFSHESMLSDASSIPDLLSKMSNEQRDLVENEVKSFHEHARSRIDEKIFDLFAIPEDIRLLVTDFVRVRLLLDRPTAFKQVIREPREQDLLDYARELRNELDGFVGEGTHHSISITYSSDLIECIIDVVNTDTPIALKSSSVKPGDVTSSRILSELSESLKEQVSQWIYVQRGLRLFDGSRIHLYKPSRLIDWTRTQAMNDAGDILGEVLAEV
ncbi:MAG: N-6 DNA methylase [Chloroflexota bacterium]|nr:N-6 DNA methylase [Chloroflexota bacterium]